MKGSDEVEFPPVVVTRFLAGYPQNSWDRQFLIFVGGNITHDVTSYASKSGPVEAPVRFGLIAPDNLLKKGQTSDSFAVHLEQQFKSTTSRTYLCKFMTFKLLN